MTDRKIFVYTMVTFLLLTLVSYIANAQTQKLSLKEAVKLAVVHNRDIKIAGLEAEKSDREIIISKSRQLPSIGINGQVAHYFQTPVFFGFGTTANGSDKIPYGNFGGRDQAMAALYVVQPLYNASIEPEIRSASLLSRGNKLAVTDKKVLIASMVKQVYIQILVLQERISLQKESIERNEKALQDAKSLLAQGRALRVDTLRAYTSVKNLEPNLLKLSAAIKVGKQELQNFIGLDTLATLELTDSLTLPEYEQALNESQVYDLAKSQRADLQVIAIQEELAEQQVKKAGATMKPVVSLAAQYLVQTQVNNFRYFDAFYPSTPFLAAQVAVPIFNGNANKARVSQAKIGREQSQVRTKNAFENLRVEVKQVVADLSETTARIQTSANVKETAKLSYDLTQYRYEKGVASRLELIDAELALTTAQSNYLEAVYDYLSAHISLERTTGAL